MGSLCEAECSRLVLYSPVNRSNRIIYQLNIYKLIMRWKNIMSERNSVCFSFHFMFWPNFKTRNTLHWLTLTREHVALSSLHVEALAVLQRLTLPSAELGAAPTGRWAGSPVRPLLPSCTTYYLSELFNTVLRNQKVL